MSNRLFNTAIALAMCAGMWAYVVRIANPRIRLQAARTGNRAGVLGDLYPRWYGTRQLVLNRQNPYGQSVSQDLQLAYYGDIVSDGSRDEQRFAYPIYVSLLLYPTVRLPFRKVQIIASVVMAGAVALSVPLWLGFIGWQVSWCKALILTLLVLSCSPAVQALEMQQLSTVVCAFLAFAAYLLRRRAYVSAGVFFALATIKPQMMLLLCFCLVLWIAGEWRGRKSLLFSFLATLAMLIGIGEWMSPGWVGEFASAATAYRHYAGGSAQSIVEMFAGHVGSLFITSAILLGLTITTLRSRHEPAESASFSQNIVLVLAISTVILPPAAPYNHLLLLPGVLILLRNRLNLWSSEKIVGGVALLAAAAILWPWIAAVGLLLWSVFVPVERWSLPFYTSLVVPLAVSALLVLQRTNTTLRLSEGHSRTTSNLPTKPQKSHQGYHRQLQMRDSRQRS